MTARLRFLLRYNPFAVPIAALLGCLSSILEGVGVTLLVPFMMVLSGAAGSANRYVDWLNHCLTGYPTATRIRLIGLGIIASVVLKNVVTYGKNRYTAWVEGRMVYRLQLQVYDQILHLSPSELDRVQPGELMTVMWGQVSRSVNVFMLLNSLLTTVAYGAVFLVLMSLMSWQLTALVVGLLGLASLALRHLGARVRATARQMAQTQANLGDIVWETIQGMREVQAFTQEEREVRKFDTASVRDMHIVYRMDALTSLLDPMTETAFVAILCVLLFIVVPMVSTDYAADMPKIMAFTFLLYRLQPQMKALESFRLQMAAALPAIDDVMAFLTERPRVGSGRETFTELRRGIEFQHVTFTYPTGSAPALRDVSLTLQAGQVTALVGRSGGGKSTIASLLLRFYDPQAGAILVDGIPLLHLDLKAWRSRIGLVSQHTFLFNDTVAGNIAYGKPDATADDIEQAARRAHAHSFIQDLSHGYQTILGDRGMRLSGGQRQRLALARAILCRPSFLILDEATSALDTISEHLVQDALASLQHSCTMLVIAHRISTVRQAHRILVVDEGRIVEDGSPEQLLRAKGSFASLYGAA